MVPYVIDTSFGPMEAGLYLASKVQHMKHCLILFSEIMLRRGVHDRYCLQILTSGMISGDQLEVKRIFALISQPLEDFKDLYYPSFFEWVSCKVLSFSSNQIYLIKGVLFLLYANMLS